MRIDIEQPEIQVIAHVPPTAHPDMNAGAYAHFTSLLDIKGLVPLASEITPGSCNIHRNRAGARTLIVNAAANIAAQGFIYYNYTFPNASWAAGDKYEVHIYDVFVNKNGRIISARYMIGFGEIP